MSAAGGNGDKDGEGRVVVVTSGKGGVGKTTTAASLSYGLAQVCYVWGWCHAYAAPSFRFAVMSVGLMPWYGIVPVGLMSSVSQAEGMMPCIPKGTFRPARKQE